jgi:hypothetical protein
MNFAKRDWKVFCLQSFFSLRQHPYLGMHGCDKERQEIQATKKAEVSLRLPPSKQNNLSTLTCIGDYLLENDVCLRSEIVIYLYAV